MNAQSSSPSVEVKPMDHPPATPNVPDPPSAEGDSRAEVPATAVAPVAEAVSSAQIGGGAVAREASEERERGRLPQLTINQAVALVATVGVTMFLFMLNYIDDGFEKVDDRFEKLEVKVDDRFEKVDDRFEKLEAKVDARFEQVDARIDGLDLKLTTLIAHLGATEAVDAAVEHRFDHIEPGPAEPDPSPP